MSIKRRRTVPTVVANVAAFMLSLSSTSTNDIAANAFVAIDTTQSFSSIARPQQVKQLYGASSTNEEVKLTIASVTDENMKVHLYPEDNRPVLVDAFAPFCGPCKLLDKVLRKAQPNYLNKVDFCRWNVNDKDNTVELKRMFMDSGHTLNKLPSLILFREGKPVAVRPGFANEYQLDNWLETELPDVLERTFDEDGIKMIPLPLPELSMIKNDKKHVITKVESLATAMDDQEDDEVKCNDPEECWAMVETHIWSNRTVVPAMDGILLPSRTREHHYQGSP